MLERVSTPIHGEGSDVAWVRPQFSSQEINAAAKLVATALTKSEWKGHPLEFEDALAIVNNHRSSHSFPLNTFQVTLRNYARSLDPGALIAQRIKRLSSINAKLARFPNMKFSQMQDIGGCRAVVGSNSDVRNLVTRYRASGLKHEFATEDDYIKEPADSGYRGLHLVYRYFSDKQAKVYNGLKIEVQLRSRYQHAWATAVETVGTFVSQALKSSVGEPDWLRFFALMGTAIALRERSPSVPGTPDERSNLVAELKNLEHKLNVRGRLRAYGDALRTLGTEQPGLELAHFYLLDLDPRANQLTVRGYRMNQLGLASKEYEIAEARVRDNPGTDAVLVSVDSLSALERAYPNYFADTRIFLQLIDQTLTGRPRRISAIPSRATAE